jgi:O-antigen/teichoic acid export membrane protein
VVAIVYFFIINLKISRLKPQFSWSLARHIIHDIRAFAASSIVAALFTRPEIVILSLIVTEDKSVSTARRRGLVELPLTLTEAFMVNVFPQLAESFRSAEDRFLKWQSAAVRVILAFTLLFAAGCLAAADEIVRIIYGDGFAEAATVLRIIAINIAFFGLISVFWRSLVARGRQGTNLKLQSFTVVVRIASGVALIAPFAAVGAAISATASSALHLGLLVRATARSGAPPALLRQSWRFVVAAGTAGGVMWALGQWIPAVVGALVGALLYLPLLLLFRAVSAEDRLLLSRLRRRDPGAARAKEAAAD